MSRPAITKITVECYFREPEGETETFGGKRGATASDKTVEDRFIRLFRMAKIEQDENGCWRWLMAIDSSGYGIISTRWEQRKNITARAHRISFLIHYGHLPKEGMICHTCDNRYCVNPKHLFWGTHLDNMADKSRKGRWGRRRSTRKLTPEAIEHAKTCLAEGLNISETARRIGYSRATVRRILARGDT